MTKTNRNKKSNGMTVGYTGADLCIDPQLLVKRVNALVVHASKVEGKDPAELNAREISTHLKSLKEIQAHNETIKTAQNKKAYTRYEDLPPPHPDDIAAFRRKLRGVLARHIKPDPQR